MKQNKLTTFILGAGASLHAGYPFVRSMGVELLAWMRLTRDTDYFDFRDTADFIETQFGDDIEDIFNGVQSMIDTRRSGYSLLAEVHKPCLVQAMRQWFASIHQEHAATAYDQFATHIVKTRRYHNYLQLRCLTRFQIERKRQMVDRRWLRVRHRRAANRFRCQNAEGAREHKLVGGFVSG